MDQSTLCGFWRWCMTNTENLIVSTILIELSLVFMWCGSMDNVEIRKQPLTRKLIKTSIILLRDEFTEWSAVRWWLVQKLLLSNACRTSYKFSHSKKSLIICNKPQQERDKCLTMNKFCLCDTVWTWYRLPSRHYGRGCFLRGLPTSSLHVPVCSFHVRVLFDPVLSAFVALWMHRNRYLCRNGTFGLEVWPKGQCVTEKDKEKVGIRPDSSLCQDLEPFTTGSLNPS